MSFNKSEFTSYKRLAIILIIIGILLALDSVTPVPFYKLWPALVGIMGGGFIGIFVKRRRRDPVLLSIGTYLILFMMLAFYSNFVGWQYITSLWPLFIGFLGIGFITLFSWYRRRKRFLFSGLVLLSLTAVFFLVFSVNPQLWWTLFVLLGVSILLSINIR